MDRIEFFKAIKYPDFPNDISSHFEESVALYNLLKDLNQDIQIITEEINPDSINFKIKADKETRDITENLVDCYGTARNYYTNCDIEITGRSRSSISLSIKRTSRL
jgi:hypothetical protein